MVVEDSVETISQGSAARWTNNLEAVKEHRQASIRKESNPIRGICRSVVAGCGDRLE